MYLVRRRECNIVFRDKPVFGERETVDALSPDRFRCRSQVVQRDGSGIGNFEAVDDGFTGVGIAVLVAVGPTSRRNSYSWPGRVQRAVGSVMSQPQRF